ncbi:MAG: hypothetical protein ABIM02_02055, partial [candidate division WOR-3 bacterium]
SVAPTLSTMGYVPGTDCSVTFDPELPAAKIGKIPRAFQVEHAVKKVVSFHVDIPHEFETNLGFKLSGRPTI